MATPNTKVHVKSALRKLTPDVRLPVNLREFSVQDQQQLRRRTTAVLEVVFDPRFARANAPALFEGPMLHATPAVVAQAVSGKGRSLTAAEERELFERFNYARYRMIRILHEFKGKRFSSAAARDLLAWDRTARQRCDEIVGANLGLVPTMIERSRIHGVDFGELISEGQYALLRSAEKFDCNRGFKFSTYACRSILTAIARAVALLARHRSRFPTEFDPNLQSPDLVDLRQAHEEEDFVRALRGVLKSNTAELTRSEKRVLSERFGFDNRLVAAPGGSGKTLREVAAIFGVTKERIRQIQNRALDKIREQLQPEPEPSMS